MSYTWLCTSDFHRGTFTFRFNITHWQSILTVSGNVALTSEIELLKIYFNTYVVKQICISGIYKQFLYIFGKLNVVPGASFNNVLSESLTFPGYFLLDL